MSNNLRPNSNGPLKKIITSNADITTPENKIDLSFLNIRAFERNNKINNNISM
jgi:hypothetical protein